MTDKKKYGVTNLLNGNKKNGVREILPSMHTIHRPGGGTLKTSLLKKFKSETKTAFKENKSFKVKDTRISKQGQRDLKKQALINKVYDKILPKLKSRIEGKDTSKLKDKDYTNVIKELDIAKSKIMSKYKKKN